MRELITSLIGNAMLVFLCNLNSARGFDIVTDLFILFCFILLAVSALLLIFVLIKLKTNASSGVEEAVREELRLGREESAKAAKDLREEVSGSKKLSMDTMVRTIGEMGKSQNDQLNSIARRIKELTESNRTGIEKLRSTIDTQ